MKNHCHTIIIGAGGAMGSAAAFHLGCRGVDFLGFDQFDIPHARGSSHGFSRMIRMCYSEHPDYVPLLRRAYELWRELEVMTRQTLFQMPGGIYMGREDSATVGGARRAAVDHGLAHEMLSNAEVRRRWPKFEIPKDFAGFFEPTAGYLIPERIIAANAAIAVGVSPGRIRAHEPVVEWSADDSGVVVRTMKDEYRAERLIIAAGTWANRVVSDLGVRITPTRQVLGWFQPRYAVDFMPERFPVWAMQTPVDFDGTENVFYGFPIDPLTGVPGLKVARHARGPMIDPDRDDRAARAEDEHDVRPFLKRFMPEADGQLLGLRICMYENSPDDHFIIDKHPKHGNVIVAAGFSGHGFKFASVVGEILADLAMRGETKHPIRFLGLHRFQS